MKKELREQEKYLLYFSYFLNEGMNDFIKIIKSLENSLIDGAASLVQPVTSPVVKVISLEE